ncbi:helix-turn-helix transcriptional regulator [Taibaiella koreensis]|uniref:helix-turn-helix transcriptional regulator n=1 Tax=Taibaiella koreensis TaxID=1268548 RepID=UPI000E59BBF3|nr:helix-turn-helix transcriptional regulator [Taibaiella koreensis]
MQAQLYLPAEPLRSHIRFYWIMANNAPVQEERTFRIMANGAPGIVFQREPTALLDRQRLPQMFLHGQNTAYYGELQAGRSFYNIGVALEPMALPALFGLAAYELTDGMTDIRLLSSQVTIAEQLGASATATQQIALLDAFFLEQLRGRQPSPMPGLTHAIALIRKGHTLSDVQFRLNLSERTLERHFRQHIGMPPKRYARICRFESAVQAIRRSDFSSLTHLAYEYGYFDQAHFIREFQAFSGTAPTSFLVKAKAQLPDFSG